MTCPTCGGVLADMRGKTMFKPIEAKAVGICALWPDGNYECAFKDRPSAAGLVLHERADNPGDFDGIVPADRKRR